MLLSQTILTQGRYSRWSVYGKGIGKQLIKASYQYAIANGYAGLYTVGQDNNLNACLFYLACGFEIGGLDTKIYENTKQSGKFDITFYMH